jgi:hypothetical protein
MWTKCSCRFSVVSSQSGLRPAVLRRLSPWPPCPPWFKRRLKTHPRQRAPHHPQNPTRRFRGMVGRTFPSRVPARTTARLLPREVRFMGRTHLQTAHRRIVPRLRWRRALRQTSDVRRHEPRNRWTLHDRLRGCPVPFFPDTKDRHPGPAAVVLAGIPGGIPGTPYQFPGRVRGDRSGRNPRSSWESVSRRDVRPATTPKRGHRQTRQGKSGW